MERPQSILPEPRTDGPMSLEAVIAQRRSIRNYGLSDLSLDEIGQLLWAANGITGDRSSQRAAPSAGGCHPLIFYVCRKDGVWRYYPKRHILREQLNHDVREELAEAAWQQDFIARAPVVFAVTAVYERTTERYDERGRVRYVPMDAGHASENLVLQAVALDLGTALVGAFDDEAVSEVLALEEDEMPLYLIPCGHPSEG